MNGIGLHILLLIAIEKVQAVLQEQLEAERRRAEEAIRHMESEKAYRATERQGRIAAEQVHSFGSQEII
jgi:hypothetical protein